MNVKYKNYAQLIQNGRGTMVPCLFPQAALAIILMWLTFFIIMGPEPV